jgi:hypothetical protein
MLDHAGRFPGHRVDVLNRIEPTPLMAADRTPERMASDSEQAFLKVEFRAPLREGGRSR